MSDTDQMTDSAELHELRDSLSGVAMPERPRIPSPTPGARNSVSCASSQSGRTASTSISALVCSTAWPRWTRPTWTWLSGAASRV
jgi:hypothetical protein